jgi:hypothetical protein
MSTINVILYLLAILASATCMGLLFRGYARTKVQLLLWGGLCFVFLTANNFLLFFDIVIYPEIDLRPYRLAASLIAVLLLLYAFLWEAE